MKCTIISAFALWSIHAAKMVQRHLNVSENEFFMCTCEHKTHLATPDDSSILLRSLKNLHS